MFIFRLMHPRGRYPNDEIGSGDAVLLTGIPLGYTCSIVRQTEVDIHDSEVCWATPSEIRFWASVALAYIEKPLSICMYPAVRIILRLPAARLDAADLRWQVAAHFRGSFLNLYASSLGQYEHYAKCDKQIQEQLFDVIRLDDTVLIRGLSCFLKANVLYSTDHMFMEEAMLLMFFSMEAALEIARQTLVREGNSNPTFEQVVERVSTDIAPTSAALEYFRECYDKRVMLVHPKNRVSAEVVPTLWADDFYDNYEVLADLYRRLLLSEA